MMKYLTGHNIIEGQYLVSDEGYIWSKALNQPLSTFKSQGYQKVTLRTTEGRRQFKVHRLVAETFVPREDLSKNYVHHKDFSRDNNRADNLQWVTNSENLALGGPGTESFGPDTRDGICRYGKSPSGEDSVNAKFTNEEINLLCKNLTSGDYKHYKEALEASGLEPTRKNKLLCSRIMNGRDWKDISSQYGIKPSHDIVRKRTYTQLGENYPDNMDELPWSINIE